MCCCAYFHGTHRKLPSDCPSLKSCLKGLKVGPTTRHKHCQAFALKGWLELVVWPLLLMGCCWSCCSGCAANVVPGDAGLLLQESKRGVELQPSSAAVYHTPACVLRLENNHHLRWVKKLAANRSLRDLLTGGT